MEPPVRIELTTFRLQGFDDRIRWIHLDSRNAP